jgi:amino acid transporter
LGRVVCILPILISISALGTANGNLFQAARYCMVGAQYGYLPEFFGFIQEKRLTPLPSIIFQVDFVKFLYRFIIIMMFY